ncbi:MAG: hypothetical protein IAE91_01665 [Ignavibacteriaceae bacterium]|nr:hypothetical protein [Ignavibacteriaceae bacterium]
MKKKKINIESIINEYISVLNKEFIYRVKKINSEIYNNQINEVLGGLMAREVTLATQIASSPSIWNGHIAPIILRTMIDTYITLAWIFKDPKERSKQYILYGLGQYKLHIEHLKKGIKEKKDNRIKENYVTAMEDWLKTQRHDFLIEVNVGSWSGISVRKMAEEANCIDFYNYAYISFSTASHSMWPHVARYNLEVCDNPLHKYHYLPINPMVPLDTHYLYLAAKYVQKTFNLFDEHFKINCKRKNAYKYLNNILP